MRSDTVRLRLCLLLSVVVVVAAACGGSGATDASAMQGKYLLESVNDSGLPYVYQRVVLPFEVRLYSVKAGRLEFHSRGRILDISSYSIPETWPDTLVGGFSVSGTRVVISRPLLAGAPPHSDTGTVSGDEIVLRVRDLPGRPLANRTFRYLRAP